MSNCPSSPWTQLGVPRSILIIRRDNIGDLVCTTPLISALRTRFPDAKIDALVNSYNRPVLAANPDLDHVYAYTKAKHRDRGESVLGVYWRRFRLMLALRRERYDLVVLANGGYLPRPLLLARWVAPRLIVGFVPSGGTRTRVDLGVQVDDVPRHEVANIFRLLQPLGISGSPPPLRLVAEPKDVQGARSRLTSQPWYLAERPTIAVHISARKVPQRWPAHRFAELMDRLHQQFHCQFMLFWSPGKEENALHPGDDRKAGAIMEAAVRLPVLPYPTDQLKDLIAGLSLCSAMICSDGGAMHIGAALGLPIVCFFGNSDPVTWHPWGVPYELIQKPSRNVADISVDEASAAFSRVIASSTRTSQ